MASLYDRWNSGESGYSNFGSFQTTILSAYRIADGNNRKKLELVYPYWFLEDYDYSEAIGESIKSIADKLELPSGTYDTAKPQPWMDAMSEQGFDRKDLYMNYVWLYDEKARIWGRPFNYMAEYARYLIALLHA